MLNRAVSGSRPSRVASLCAAALACALVGLPSAGRDAPKPGGSNPGGTGAGPASNNPHIQGLNNLIQQAAAARQANTRLTNLNGTPVNLAMVTQPGANKPNPNQPLDPAAAEYAARLAEQTAQILKYYATAEELFQKQQYREAASFYGSVAISDLTDARIVKAREIARGRFVELDGLAQQHLKAADDALINRQFVQAVEEFNAVLRDFPFTQSKNVAQQRLLNLRGRKDVAGFIELGAAEAAEAAGDLLQAIRLFKAIADNPLYEGTVPALKARRRYEAMQKDDNIREQVKQQIQTEADKFAPPLMNAARNYLMNEMKAAAKEKFQIVVERFPGTKFAEEALAEVKKLE